MDAVLTERRQAPRQPAHETEWRHARLRTGDLLALIDIAAGGALVECRRRLLPGTAMVVVMVSEDRVLCLDARVVRCAVFALEGAGAVRYRGGLEFVDLSGRLDQIAEPLGVPSAGTEKPGRCFVSAD
jgi:hypothetical protein